MCAGTGQLIVAGAGIFHPEWIATAWQTCAYPFLLCLRSLYGSINQRLWVTDLIFLAVTAVSSVVCIFFNRALPMIDVSTCPFHSIFDSILGVFTHFGLILDDLCLLDWLRHLQCATDTPIVS